MTTQAFKLLDFIMARDGDKPRIKGLYVTAVNDCPNSYGPEYKVITVGTTVRLDFGGDFGFYGFADVDGVIRRTRVNIQDVHRFDWSPHQAGIDGHAMSSTTV